MGKVTKVIVCGLKGVGKTALLHQLIFGKTDYQDIHPTIEDMYAAVVQTDRGSKEVLRLYDTEGLSLADDLTSETVLPKQYYSLGDAFLFVYSVHNSQSFALVEMIKKDLDKYRDKREAQFVAIGLRGNNSPGSDVIDSKYITNWAVKEKVKVFECSIVHRDSLFPPFVYIASKATATPAKATFAPLGIVRKPKDIPGTGGKN